MSTEVTKATNTLGNKGSNVSNNQNKEEKGLGLVGFLKQNKELLTSALPPEQRKQSDKFLRTALTYIRDNPKLLECSLPSVLGAFMNVATLGLEVGNIFGHCYLIPYDKKDKNGNVISSICQFQLGYKGMIELLRRTGQLKDIYAYEVCKNDEFTIQYGLERDLIHKPAFENTEGRGEVTGFYAVAILKDGTRAFHYMTKKEIYEHEVKFRKGKFQNLVWKDSFDSMAKKTVAKAMLKWLPISIDIIEKMNVDEKVYQYNQATKENLETPVLDSDGLNESIEAAEEVPYNSGTGEVISTEENKTSEIGKEKGEGLFEGAK